MKFTEQWYGTAQTICSQDDAGQRALLALELSGQGLQHAIHDWVDIVEPGTHQSVSNQSGGVGIEEDGANVAKNLAYQAYMFVESKRWINGNAQQLNIVRYGNGRTININLSDVIKWFIARMSAEEDGLWLFRIQGKTRKLGVRVQFHGDLPGPGSYFLIRIWKLGCLLHIVVGQHWTDWWQIEWGRWRKWTEWVQEPNPEELGGIDSCLHVALNALILLSRYTLLSKSLNQSYTS